MNSASIIVRPARPDDAAGIAGVHIQSWRETYSGLIPDRFMNDDALEMRRTMWTTILALDPLPGTIAVAEREGQLIGFAFAGSSDHSDATKGFPQYAPCTCSRSTSSPPSTELAQVPLSCRTSWAISLQARRGRGIGELTVVRDHLIDAEPQCDGEMDGAARPERPAAAGPIPVRFSPCPTFSLPRSSTRSFTI